ncbi:MAG: hypothetical protein QM764_09995 [Chitinophagaceae bacterium]
MNTIEIDLGELNNSCFVAMPFNILFRIEYEKIIQPALMELNIKCIRGDEVYAKQRIVDDIWHSIKSCRFVLAELTDKNPNVLYEVGLAHAIGKPVIIITRNSDDVPFDLKALRYLFYDVNDPFWGDNLKLGIQNLAQKIIESPNIENYLEGITIKSKYPKISIQPKKKSKSNISLTNISGLWFGKFEDTENILHSVTLQLNQTEDSIIGASVISYTKGDKLTVVQEIINGTFKSDVFFELHGVNYTFIERGNAGYYLLDNFSLKVDKENNSLSGEVTISQEPEQLKAKIEFTKSNSS